MSAEHSATHVSNIFANVGEYIASLSFGQYVFKKIDRLLWMVEKTAQWSVPYSKIESSDDDPANGSFIVKETKLIRPLPWILFLPTLIFMRVSRGMANIAAFLLGMESITSEAVVKAIQTRRRRLRAVRFLGIRNIRQKEAIQEDNHCEGNLLQRLKNRISNLLDVFTPKLDKPVDKKSMLDVFNCGTDKRKYEEVDSNAEDLDDEIESINTLIQRLNDFVRVSDDSDEDPDFKPANSGDDTSESSDDSLEEENPVRPPVNRDTSEVITEENEDNELTTNHCNENDEQNEEDGKTMNDNINSSVDENGSDQNTENPDEQTNGETISNGLSQNDYDEAVRERENELLTIKATSQGKDLKGASGELIDKSSSSGEFCTPAASSNGSPERQTHGTNSEKLSPADNAENVQNQQIDANA